jgi:ABC-type sugar transport system ATPase subunit
VDNPEVLLQMKGILKSFGAVQALDGVDFELYPNEILGLVGDNGAGKSTLIKIISGVLMPDAGEIFLEGRKIHMRSPHQARELGIETVYQDLGLLDTLDVPKNIFIGREPRAGLFFFKMREMIRRTKSILASLHIEIPSTANEVRLLSGGQRQAIAVGRAAYWGHKIVIMDEPTAALGVEESFKVLELAKVLKSRNVSVIMISHNLEHVFKVADRIIVLRKGKRVAARQVRETSGDEIVKFITGAEFAAE